MNQIKTKKLESIKQKLRFSLTRMNDLIRWCESYKNGLGTIGSIMYAFSLKWNDVCFIIDNLMEIKKMELNK